MALIETARNGFKNPLGLMELAPKITTFPKKKWWPRRFDVSTASSGSTSAPASTSSWMQATLPCRAATCKAVLPARTTRGSRGDRRICSNSWWHVAKIRYLWVPFATMGTYHLWHLLRGKHGKSSTDFWRRGVIFLGKNGNYMAIHRKMVFGCHQLPPLAEWKLPTRAWVRGTSIESPHCYC